MSSTQVEVQGTLRPDGTILLSRPVGLPPGQVRLIVQSLEAPPASPDRFWKMMEDIWAGQRARGHQPRTTEQIDAEIAAMRDEAEEELREVERAHEECQRSAHSAGKGPEPGQ